MGVVAVPDISPRYNIAPTQPVLGVVQVGDDRTWSVFQWGLVPSWAKDPSIGSRMINARAETLTEKPSFRTAFKRRRCLIPADGFYEWQGPAGSKQPFYITCQHHPFAFAGLWEHWEGTEGELETCTIVTTHANELVSQIHERMPVILSESEYATWLDLDTPAPVLEQLLDPFPASQMTMHAVGKLVGNPKYDDESLIAPIGPTNLFD